jgi:hypothetical protein
MKAWFILGQMRILPRGTVFGDRFVCDWPFQPLKKEERIAEQYFKSKGFWRHYLRAWR